MLTPTIPNKTRPQESPLMTSASPPFFEVASNIGFTNGIVNVTLAAAQHLIKDGAPHTDIVSMAYLRCNLTAAIGLRDALNGAILLGSKQQGGAH